MVKERQGKVFMQNGTSSTCVAEKLIDLNDLRIFAYVASLSSFSLAADALQIHKSSVSRSISRLEAMLETPLLQRTTRKVLLTQRGVDLGERCVELLSKINETIGQVGGIDTAPECLAIGPGPATIADPGKGTTAVERKPLHAIGRLQARLAAGRIGRPPEAGRFASAAAFTPLPSHG